MTISSCQKKNNLLLDEEIDTIIAANTYSNSELIHLIKHQQPPLSDQELLGVLIAASPLDDNIIKEVLKRGNPPANATVSDQTLQLILLRNLPLSDHIVKEVTKYRNGPVFNRSLIDDIQLENLPSMQLEDANFMLEAILNLKYGRACEMFDTIVEVTHTFQVQGSLNSGDYFILSDDFISSLECMNLQCVAAPAGINVECLAKNIRVIDLNITTEIEPATGDKIFNIDLTTFVAIRTLPVPTMISSSTLCQTNENYSFSSLYYCWWAPKLAKDYLNLVMSDPFWCNEAKIGCDFYTDVDLNPLSLNDNGALCFYFLHIYFNNWVGNQFCVSPAEINLKAQRTWDLINDLQYRPFGKAPALVINGPVPGNALCQGNQMYFNLDVRYGRCGPVDVY